MARKPCRSPLDGGDYPEYVGPVQDFARWCFICGDPVSCVIQHRGSPRLFGVCAGHRKLLPKMATEAESSILNLNGQSRLLSSFQPKKSIFEVISETEAEFQRRDRERGLLPEEP